MSNHRYVLLAEYLTACETVIEEARVSKPNALIRYAATYAEYGLTLNIGTSECRIQCLYILNNLSAWRGDKAKYVKGVLKHFSTYSN